VDKARLQALLAPVRLPEDPRVLVGISTGDDAGVVRVSDDLALVQTVDFFPPMVDDPRGFGRVGAANSVSDVYAMGGTPLCAVSILAIPEDLPAWVPAEILSGAVEVLTQANTAFVGGHTVNDKEVKFGFSVVGTIHPSRVWTNAAAKPGDALVLTKPLGSGYLCTAIKKGSLPAEDQAYVVDVMSQLNRGAAEAMNEVGVHAATDVTGFGLSGHAIGMADAAGVTFRLHVVDLPLMQNLVAHATPANVCGGLGRNLAYAEKRTAYGNVVTDFQRSVVSDPQTSGGMLIAVAKDRLPALLAALEARGVATRAVVGEVVPRGARALEVV
jgi:selenide,water dikinase